MNEYISRFEVSVDNSFGVHRDQTGNNLPGDKGGLVFWQTRACTEKAIKVPSVAELENHVVVVFVP